MVYWDNQIVQSLLFVCNRSRMHFLPPSPFPLPYRLSHAALPASSTPTQTRTPLLLRYNNSANSTGPTPRAHLAATRPAAPATGVAEAVEIDPAVLDGAEGGVGGGARGGVVLVLVVVEGVDVDVMDVDVAVGVSATVTRKWWRRV